MDKKTVDKFKLCLLCGNYCHIEEEQIHCVVCGEKMVEKCPHCNEQIIYPTGKYCHKCGYVYRQNRIDKESK